MNDRPSSISPERARVNISDLRSKPDPSKFSSEHVLSSRETLANQPLGDSRLVPLSVLTPPGSGKVSSRKSSFNMDLPPLALSAKPPLLRSDLPPSSPPLGSPRVSLGGRSAVVPKLDLSKVGRESNKEVFDEFAISAIPELSVSATEATRSLQRIFRNYIENSRSNWRVDFVFFQRVIGRKLVQSQFDKVCQLFNEETIDIREWLLAVISGINGVSTEGRIRFGFSIFTWAGDLDRKGLISIIRALVVRRESLPLHEIENRVNYIYKNSMSLDDVLAASSIPGLFEPGIFYPPASKFGKKHIILDEKKKSIQHQIDREEASLRRLINAGFRIPRCSPPIAIFVCLSGGLGTLLILRFLVSGVGGIVIDAFAALCGFGAIVVCGALLLGKTLTEDIEHDDFV